jgi:hypothetical protein
VTFVAEDTVTRYPAEPGAAATILFVVRPEAPPIFVWYTHVLPTRTGNGIELALANDFDATPCRTPTGSPSVPELPVGPGLPWPEELALGAAVDDCADWEALPADEVAPVVGVVWLDTCGAVPLGTPLHPATTKPARATLTRAGTCLLM